MNEQQEQTIVDLTETDASDGMLIDGLRTIVIIFLTIRSYFFTFLCCFHKLNSLTETFIYCSVGKKAREEAGKECFETFICVVLLLLQASNCFSAVKQSPVLFFHVKQTNKQAKNSPTNKAQETRSGWGLVGGTKQYSPKQTDKSTWRGDREEAVYFFVNDGSSGGDVTFRCEILSHI
jgi:hypothetical protein